MNNVYATVFLLRALGLTLHPEKSIIIPIQIIDFFGFIINSTDMTISLSEQKFSAIKAKTLDVLDSKKLTIGDLASVIGSLMAAFPAVKYGRVHYRHLPFPRS